MVFPLLRQPAREVEHCKISNSKHQITKKSQIPILNDQKNLKFQYSMTKTGLEFVILVIVICLIFVICDLEFLFLQYFSTPKQLAILAEVITKNTFFSLTFQRNNMYKK
jgi:uncharacterized integral membrane protein